MDMDSSNSSTMVMMVPWLHFTGGDNLLFKTWHPSSHGAIAGACIGLVLFAIFERWFNAMRGVLEAYWRQRALALMASTRDGADCSSESVVETTKDRDDNKVQEVPVTGSLPSQDARRARRPLRSLPPFIASHDIPRGALFAFQALLYYTLMLAVMTFQVAYIISIIVGLATGEVLFGRLGGAKTHFSH